MSRNTGAEAVPLSDRWTERNTAVSSEAWAKLREWAILAGKGRLLLSGSVVLASLKAAVHTYATRSLARALRRRGHITHLGNQICMYEKVST